MTGRSTAPMPLSRLSQELPPSFFPAKPTNPFPLSKTPRCNPIAMFSCRRPDFSLVSCRYAGSALDQMHAGPPPIN
jgi:hypothetical protein